MSTEHGRHGSVLGETGETKGSSRRTTWVEPKRRAPGSDLANGLRRVPGATGSTPPEVVAGPYTLDAPGLDRSGVLVAVSSEDPAAVAQWVDQFEDEGEGGGAVSCQKGSGCTLKCAVLAIQAPSGRFGHGRGTIGADVRDRSFRRLAVELYRSDRSDERDLPLLRLPVPARPAPTQPGRPSSREPEEGVRIVTEALGRPWATPFGAGGVRRCLISGVAILFLLGTAGLLIAPPAKGIASTNRTIEAVNPAGSAPSPPAAPSSGANSTLVAAVAFDLRWGGPSDDDHWRALLELQAGGAPQGTERAVHHHH